MPSLPCMFCGKGVEVSERGRRAWMADRHTEALERFRDWSIRLRGMLVADTHGNIWIGKNYSVADLRRDLNRMTVSLMDDLAELAGPNLGDGSGRRFLRRARPVVGPCGQRYPSASLAAAAEGVPVQTMISRCRKGYLGWRYADSTHVR